MFYTYAHYTADTNEIFYIGKGQKNRFKKSDNRNRWWHNKVNKHGFVAKILCYWEKEEDALSHERLLLDCFRGKLVNIQDRDDKMSGYKLSEETRLKMSKTHKERDRSNVCYRALSEALKGKRKSDEHKKNLSKSRTGSKVPSIWKPIFCITNNTLYPSLTEAAEKTGCDPSHIVKCCKGKLKKTKRMEFKYVSVDVPPP